MSTILYELSDQPAEALEQIKSHFGQPREAADESTLEDRLFFEAMAMLTEDNYVDAKVTENIAGVFHYLGEREPEIRGPLGLNVALTAAQTATLAAETDKRDEAEEEARQLLGDEAIQHCFGRFYGIADGFLLDQSRLHRIGTTSLILRCPLKPEEKFGETMDTALKCLLPRYHGVRAIRAATEEYKATNAYPGAPAVRDSTSLTIAMDFIEGETLEEHLEKRAAQSKDRSLSETDIAFLRDLGVAICKSLDRLAQQDRQHLDLSPSNIIIEDLDTRPMRLRLIDFGHNFMINERVGSSAAFRRAELYVAPELMDNPSLKNWHSDVYSLGVILLSAAAKRQLKREEVGLELDRLWQGDLEWEGAPTLARAIEEMIDDDPRQRLILMDAPETDNPYPFLSRLIVQEAEVMSIYAARTESDSFGLLRGKGLAKFYGNAQVSNLFEAGKKIENPIDDSYEDFSALGQWAVVAILCWAFAVGSFVVFTLADIGFAGVAPQVKQFAEATGAKFEVGAFWGNLAGRLVALSFSLTAVTYYVNNFSMLSPKRIGRRIGNAAEMAMRATAIFLAVPTMYAMLYAPHAWPICAGIGTSLVVLNNFLALCVAVRATEIGKRFSTRKAAGDRFITEVFKEWWRLMGYYSAALFVIGVLLLVGTAQDEGIFAVLVVVINVAKMYRLNCVELAPQVRGCLARDILTLRRDDRQPRPLPEKLGKYEWKRIGHEWKTIERIYDWWWKPPKGGEQLPSPSGVAAGEASAG